MENVSHLGLLALSDMYYHLCGGTQKPEHDMQLSVNDEFRSMKLMIAGVEV